MLGHSMASLCQRTVTSRYDICTLRAQTKVRAPGLLSWRASPRQHNSLAKPARDWVRCTAVAAPPSTSANVSPSTHAAPESTPSFDFACPICQQTTFTVPNQPLKGASLSCPRCSRSFNASPDGCFIDLTLTSGAPPRVYQQKGWGGQELFRSPLISFVYERGWRQGFAWAGFPGADEEFALAMGYLRRGRRLGGGRESGQMGVLVDMSCGSGLFTRRFASSGEFAGVVAADFSETMLQQTRDYLRQEGSGSSSPVVLVRADVGRLPFATGSVDAIHAGAAIHCWPNPQAALAEISRVLAPGGVFVASTFLAAAAPLGQLLGNDDLVRPLNQVDMAGTGRVANYKWWEEGELRDLCAVVGLQDFQRERRWRFIMFAARKPGSVSAASSTPSPGAANGRSATSQTSPPGPTTPAATPATTRTPAPEAVRAGEGAKGLREGGDLPVAPGAELSALPTASLGDEGARPSDSPSP